MPLHLLIENETSLPDGGPIRYSVTNKRGIDIGRDQYLDWVLPDPTRMISGKHCEIRFKDGRYWLIDVSTNGTYVNRSEFRIPGPHALNTGDRIEIGRFIIAVTVEPEAGLDSSDPEQFSAGPGNDGQLWNVGGDAAPAINPRELRAPSVSAGIGSYDMLDWAANIPSVSQAMSPPAPAYPPPAAPPAYAPPPAPPAYAAPASAFDWGAPELPPPIATPQPARPAPPPPMPAAQPLSVAVAQEPAPASYAPSPMDTRQPAQQASAWDIESAEALPALPGQRAAEAPETPVASEEPPRAAPQREETHRPQQVRPEPPLPTGESVFAEVQPKPARPRAMPAGAGTIVERFAKGAGVAPDQLQVQDPGEFAEILGAMVRMTVDNLRQLQMARTQAKGLMRSSHHTLIQATDNNPLRFCPSTDEVFRIMFGPRTNSYLGPRESLDQSFIELKKHQMLLFTSMQTALKSLIDDLDPAQIAAAVEQDKGFGSLLNSKKAKQWERFETLWNAKVGKNEQGMLGVFMLLFAEAYDKSS
jgi:type VI secretion system protein ImpI